MGLLNDAIREHLELKRQHGADPVEVARLEHEVLGPLGHEDLSNDVPVTGGYSESSPELTSNSEASVGASVDSLEGTMATGQETAELDMQTVLSDHPASPSTGQPGGDSEGSGVSMNDPQMGPGWDSDAVDAPGRGHEDVLEETPDFLQETPEHERLWFEQRPPRDFDFDK